MTDTMTTETEKVKTPLEQAQEELAQLDHRRQLLYLRLLSGQASDEEEGSIKQNLSQIASERLSTIIRHGVTDEFLPRLRGRRERLKKELAQVDADIETLEAHKS
jgi:hypothetical protein